MIMIIKLRVVCMMGGLKLVIFSIVNIASRSEEEKCFREMVDRAQNVKNARSLGLLLKIESWKLDRFERDPSTNTVILILREWFKRMPQMSIDERWEEFIRVLMEPAVMEWKLAKDLQPYLRRGSSIDSAISEMSSPRSSITSSTEIPPQYQMAYIGSYDNLVVAISVIIAMTVCRKYST